MAASIFSVLYNKLKEKKNCVLIRIIRHEGSTPRGIGSSCLVDDGGELTGTIGGGLVEYRAVEKARLLLEKGVTSLSTFEMNAKEIENEGMICGGRVKLFFEPILAEDREALEFFGIVDRLVGRAERAVLVTRLSDGVEAKTTGMKMLVAENGSSYGAVPGFSSARQVNQTEIVFDSERKISILLEPLRQSPELLLFGAGHISTFVAPLAKMVGFRVRVIDDRSEFANRDRFPEADDIYAIPYAEVFEKLAVGRDSYLVIVTRGHGMDKEVLELILNLDIEPAYIGMIGSLRKRDTIYKALMDKGIEQKSLAAVYSPIGLDIAAETPEEIAVSIMGEVIKVRAGRSKVSDIHAPAADGSGSLRFIK